MPPKGIGASPSQSFRDRERARRLVKSITEQHGYLGEDVLSQMLPDVRRKVEEAMLKKDEMIGSSVITLSKNLYNSSARFVFELLQNADDNSYSKAESLSAVPSVSFRVYRRRIVLECNEDGFTHENLIAICNVGKSSKAGAQGYIGEKGIGFKSVFMVAWKVHIQSGNFSFYFQHKMGDSGMGMISPIWEDSEEPLTHPLTRITLFLHETGSDEILAKQRETTLQQFQELQATFLLFMKNLRRIEIKTYGDDDEQISSTTFSIKHKQGHRVELKREILEGEETKTYTQYYHVTKVVATGLQKSENRIYTDAELSQKAYAKAEVVLAFPLTHDSIPIIESQEVFAFLPIRNMGFPFVIHSDFVTDASRQDIVRSSARNGNILSIVARIFVRAVSQFCEHPTLRYQWMRYLPSDKVYSQSSFWTKLLDDIRLCLEMTPTLWTKSHRELRCIGGMRRLKPTMLDENGEPLFPDLPVEQYLASEYSPEDLDLLENYGLQWVKTKEFLARVSQDLDQGELSIMRSPSTHYGWHTRVAVFLTHAWPDFPITIEGLALIPLIGEQWRSGKSARTAPIYYSHVNGNPIPTDLKLNLVDPRAEEHSFRKKLFSCLWVQEPRAPHIRRTIMLYHSRNNVDLVNSQKHLAFLYLTAHLDRENDDAGAYSDIKLVDHMYRKRAPQSHTFYFSDDDPYGPQQLLQKVDSGASHSGAPGLDVSFLHCDYMREYPTQPEGETRTWKTWISETRHVREVLPLARCGQLSEECLYVAKYRPEKFLGFLLKCWKSEGSKITENQTLTNELLEIEVLCKNGEMYPLAKSYVYTAQLKYADRFLRGDEFFPWLRQEESLSNSPGLCDLEVVAKALGFGFPQSELEFYLTILRFIMAANNNDEAIADVSRVFDLYSRIQARYRESATPDISLKMIREAFHAQPLIYVPAYGRDCDGWTFPHSCLWKAPADFVLKNPLKPRYDSIQDGKYITEFFRDTLAIPDAGIDDFLYELVDLMDTGSDSFDRIYNLYCQIDQMRPAINSETAEKVRKYFENHALIFHERNNVANWYRPSQCLWSTVTDIKGMVALNDLYEDLSDFFVQLLGVRSLTLEMVHDKLVEQGRGQSSVSDVKETIWLLNSYLQDEEELPGPRKVIASKVFPVRYPNGTVELCSSEVDFAISDRKHMLSWFSGKAKFLDFNINDIPRLEPFLRWVGLEGRYLSSCVKEISSLCGDSYRSLASSDQNIARKAHGLLRIAVHFKSPRARKDEQAFYELLKKIDVCETDGISSELHLNQDGKDIKVEVSRSELHIQENKSRLTIYVPRNKQAQYLCFLDRIPLALLEWIMTEPSTGICEPLSEKALNVMHRVLQAQAEYVALTLDRAGILSVETRDDLANAEIEVATHTDHTSPEQSNVTQTPSHGNGNNSAWDTMSSTLYEPSVASTDVEEITTTTASSRASRASYVLTPTRQRTLGPRGSLSPWPESSDQIIDSEYRRLLYSVVNAARRAVLPNRGPFDMAALSGSLDTCVPGNDDGCFRLRTSEKIERDKMIGAAGELFVFEVLSSLNPTLPKFSRENWQSTIRQYVRVHHDYIDMEPWIGRETADITYTDNEGVLTSLLIDKGYLRSDIWAGRRPKYYLEVKSSTLSWETPFYMSKYQYERMQKISHSETGSENLESVYVIFRVFNLGRDSAGMKVYVDPDSMRKRGELSFTAETWSIAPGPTP